MTWQLGNDGSLGAVVDPGRDSLSMLPDAHQYFFPTCTCMALLQSTFWIERRGRSVKSTSRASWSLLFTQHLLSIIAVQYTIATANCTMKLLLSVFYTIGISNCFEIKVCNSFFSRALMLFSLRAFGNM